jgi:hypothetical protein
MVVAKPSELPVREDLAVDPVALFQPGMVSGAVVVAD